MPLVRTVLSRGAKNPGTHIAHLPIGADPPPRPVLGLQQDAGAAGRQRGMPAAVQHRLGFGALLGRHHDMKLLALGGNSWVRRGSGPQPRTPLPSDNIAVSLH